MQQRQPNRERSEDHDIDNPALSKVIERNIHSELADLEMETRPEDVLSKIHRLQVIESSKRVPS